MKYYSMNETRKFLESIGQPGGDLYDLPDSEKRFPDGGQYRFEVPGIQGPGPMKALLEQLDEYGIQIHRVTQTKGVMFLTDDEIKQMVEYAKKWKVQLILACGPRATTDTSASVKTEEGQRMGYRLRGQEQIFVESRRSKGGPVLGFVVFLSMMKDCCMFLMRLEKQAIFLLTATLKFLHIQVMATHVRPMCLKVLERTLSILFVIFRCRCSPLCEPPLMYLSTCILRIPSQVVVSYVITRCLILFV